MVRGVFAPGDYVPSSPAEEPQRLWEQHFENGPRMALAGASRALSAALRRPCHLGGGLLEANR